jgi:hypothetical protein
VGDGLHLLQLSSLGIAIGCETLVTHLLCLETSKYTFSISNFSFVIYRTGVITTTGLRRLLPIYGVAIGRMTSVKLVLSADLENLR